ncbi:MAG: hypothetical protein EOP06_00370 [Proteobacteria bacterium]|nr:MAG: hypothetical protein EOP06_00370 [Pseudomonadota bacterium]
MKTITSPIDISGIIEDLEALAAMKNHRIDTWVLDQLWEDRNLETYLDGIYWDITQTVGSARSEMQKLDPISSTECEEEIERATADFGDHCRALHAFRKESEAKGISTEEVMASVVEAYQALR